MADWKEVKNGPQYTGPDDETLRHIITAFGTQRGCLLSYIVKHVGSYHTAWPETLEEKINRLAAEGKLTVSDRLNDTFIEWTLEQ